MSNFRASWHIVCCRCQHSNRDTSLSSKFCILCLFDVRRFCESMKRGHGHKAAWLGQVSHMVGCHDKSCFHGTYFEWLQDASSAHLAAEAKCVEFFVLRPLLIYRYFTGWSHFKHFAKTSPALFFIKVTSQVQLCKVLTTWLKLAADWLASLSAMTVSSATVQCELSPPAATAEETAATKGSEVFIAQLE